MALKNLRYDKLLKMMDINDEYEISDNDESDTGENGAEQILICGALEMEKNSAIETYLNPERFVYQNPFLSLQYHKILTNSKKAQNFVNVSVGLINAR